MEQKPLTVDEVKDRLPVKVSDRTLREKIRAAGCYMQIGRTMMLTEADYAELLEALRPCRSKSSKGQKARTSTLGGQSQASILKKALELATERGPNI